jgi:hypothetical protein
MSTGDSRYRGAMEYARLETASLAPVDDSYYYGAFQRTGNVAYLFGEPFGLRER